MTNSKEIANIASNSVSASLDDSSAGFNTDFEEEWGKVKPLADAIENEKIALGTMQEVST